MTAKKAAKAAAKPKTLAEPKETPAGKADSEDARRLAEDLHAGAWRKAEAKFLALAGRKPKDKDGQRIFALVRNRIARQKAPSEMDTQEVVLLGVIKLNAVTAAHGIFERMIALAPEDDSLVYRKAMLYYRTGEATQAAELWEGIRERYERPLDLLKLLSQAYLISRESEKAKACIAEAISRAPRDAEARVILGKTLALEKDYTGAAEAFRQALLRNSKERDAYSGLIASYGKADKMKFAEHAANFFVRRFPSYVAPKALSGVRALLLEHTSRMLLTDTRYGRKAYAVNNMVSMMNDGRVAFSHLYIDLSRDPASEALRIPPCDVIYNNAANAELLLANKGFMLRRAQAICRNLDLPVINPVEKVIQTTRRRNYERFHDFAGLTFPKTIKLTFDAGREDEVVRLIEEAIPYPLILRQSYTHADTETDRVRDEKELRAVLPKYAGKAAYIIQYFDCSDAEGVFRRYRVLFVGERMFPSSVLAAPDWNVHSSSAVDLMEKSETLKEQERAYQKDMASVVGQDTLDIFWKIREIVGLDYFGIDYNFDTQGNLVIFEINPSMNLAIRERGSFAYLAKANNDIIRAMEDLMIERARSPQIVPAPLRRLIA